VLRKEFGGGSPPVFPAEFGCGGGGGPNTGGLGGR